MSLGTFARVWATSPASGNALLVHLALADLARDRLVQIPQADLAELARCSVTTTARALQELVELGVIVVIDERRKPPIYGLSLQSDDFSHPVTTRHVDNHQNDGILQPDGIEPQESGQIEGERVQRTGDVKSTSDVRPPFEAGITRGTVPDSEPFRAQTPNIGKFIPVVEEIPNVVELRELQDEVRLDVQKATGIERVVVQDPAPTTFRAMSGAAVRPSAGNLVEELAEFLKVIGVKQNPEAPLYWYRDEHVKDFEGLLRLAGKSGATLINEVRAAGIKMPDLRRIPDINERLAAAKIIPF
jgi:DNA-binding Lrp family transcriptional regulator